MFVTLIRSSADASVVSPLAGRSTRRRAALARHEEILEAARGGRVGGATFAERRADPLVAALSVVLVAVIAAVERLVGR